MSVETGFCTRCSNRVTFTDDMTCCPNCGTPTVPCRDAHQVEVSVNVHELRVLCIWAENWATKECGGDSPETVYAIAARLRRQLGEHDAPLTMADEFKQLREAGHDIETNHPGDRP